MAIPGYDELNTLEYWQQRLASIEDEINAMIGAVGGNLANFSPDLREAYERLVAERSYAKAQISTLGGGTVATESASFKVATASRYGNR